MNHKFIKNLALANGIVGIVGGAFLIISGIIFLIAYIWLLGMGTDDPDYNLSLLQAIKQIYPVFLIINYTVGIIFFLPPKLAIIILGIIGQIKFKKIPEFPTSNNIFFIIGGAISLLPGLELLGGIIVLIIGILYLTSRRQFINNHKENTNEQIKTL